MLPRSENPDEGARPQPSQQETREPASSDPSGEAAKAVDEVDLTCAVCEKVIPAGKEYTVAAFGPVHTEPCSHQSRVSDDVVPLV